MRLAFPRFLNVLGVGLSLFSTGCDSDETSTPRPPSEEEAPYGQLGLDLALAPGVILDSFSYSISGPGGFTRAGTVDTSASTVFSTTIGALPAGSGFNISVESTSSDGSTHCEGAAPFGVTPHSTTSVTVNLHCHEAPKTGSVQVNGTINVCPVIDGITVSPAVVNVGTPIALSALAHDGDGAPAALSYGWSSPSGIFSNATVANPTFTCTAVETVTLSLAVTDGDCVDTLTTPVTCVPRPDVVINEIESSGGVPGDWVELFNAGTTRANISGWKFKDSDNSHAFYVIPAGTTIPVGGYLVLEEAQFIFGLGTPDSARLFDNTEAIVDSFSWTPHATTTYGRCPDGTGMFTTTGSATKGAANDCSAGGGTGGAGGVGGVGGAGGAPASGGVGGVGGAGGTTGGAGGTTGAAGGTTGGAGGVGGTGGAGGATSFAWPGTDAVVTVDNANTFGTNMSGLNYQPAAGTDPAILWAIQNSPSKLYRLIFNGTIWTPDTANGWGAGKLLHYTTGTGAPDTEAVSRAEWTDSGIYVASERDNNDNAVSRLSILRFDTSAPGTEFTATNDWNVTADLPVVGANLGLEGITYVPDTALVAGAFFDEARSATYDPATYPNHGTGLFFVGVEGNGIVYAYALDHLTNAFTRVATFASGQTGIMDLSYDREVGYLWGYCDNTCGNKATVFRLDTGAASPTRGRFQISRVFDRPSTLPNSNNEGITFTPEAECSAGQKAFFWSDDDQADGHALRRGSIPCGSFF